MRSNADPRPTIVLKGIQVLAKEPTTKVAKFALGTIRIRGTNTKEDPVRSQFTVYESGTDEVVSSSKPTTDWVIFDVPAGAYDVKAVDMTATSEDKPHVRINSQLLSLEKRGRWQMRIICVSTGSDLLYSRYPCAHPFGAIAIDNMAMLKNAPGVFFTWGWQGWVATLVYFFLAYSSI